MKNVGIITLLYNNYNYGGILQAYALLRYLNSRQYCAKGVLYSGNRNVVYKSTREKLKQYKVQDILKKAISVYQGKVNGNKISAIINKRKNLFVDFVRDYIPSTDVYNDGNIGEIDRCFDYFISGSDQVWNPNCALYPFVQGFVTDNNKKISYAASVSRSSLTDHEADILGSYISQFHAISVREKTAERLLKKIGIANVETVLDPTFLLTKEEWSDIIKPKKPGEKKYALCYFFSDSTYVRNKIAGFCRSNGIELKFIPYAKMEYNSYDQKGEGDRLNDIGPLEFISLLAGAEYVFTDSFHGTALSINLEKQFFVFEREKKSKQASMNSRIYDLLSTFQLQERLVEDISSFDVASYQNIDYSLPLEVLSDLRLSSERFLYKSLMGPETDELNDVAEGGCSGNKPIVYLAGYSDKYAVKSSSGGAFSAISEAVINNGGVVYGVCFDEKFNAVYERIDHVDALKSIQGSKYVRSEFTSDVSFDTVVQDLKEGKSVLFSGTACTIDGLYKYLQKKAVSDDKLITVEVICHGTPTNATWRSYKDYLEDRYKSRIISVNFRDKKKSWRAYGFSAKFENGKVYSKLKEFDPYMQMYLAGYLIPEGCVKCRYKGNRRVSDITLGDLWGINIGAREEEERNGLSLITANSLKGKLFLEYAGSSANITELQAFQESIALSNIMQCPPSVPKERKETINRILKEKGFKEAYSQFKNNEKRFVFISGIKGSIKRLK